MASSSEGQKRAGAVGRHSATVLAPLPDPAGPLLSRHRTECASLPPESHGAKRFALDKEV